MSIWTCKTHGVHGPAPASNLCPICREPMEWATTVPLSAFEEALGVFTPLPAPALSQVSPPVTATGAAATRKDAVPGAGNPSPGATFQSTQAMAAEIRARTNGLTPEQRAAAYRRGMELIQGEYPVASLGHLRTLTEFCGMGPNALAEALEEERARDAAEDARLGQALTRAHAEKLGLPPPPDQPLSPIDALFSTMRPYFAPRDYLRFRERARQIIESIYTKIGEQDQTNAQIRARWEATLKAEITALRSASQVLLNDFLATYMGEGGGRLAFERLPSVKAARAALATPSAS